MASARVVLRKRSNPAVWVQADLRLDLAPWTRVRSRLGDIQQELSLPDGSGHPSHISAEAAFYSGVLYALGQLDVIHGPATREDNRYVLTIERLSGVYAPEDNEGFAHAGVVGVARLLERRDLLGQVELGDWQLENCEVSEEEPMPKLRCKCGNVIDLSPIPAPDGYHLISETLWGEIADRAVSVEQLEWEFLDRATIVYLCPVCQRLIIEWDREQKQAPTVYRREAAPEE